MSNPTEREQELQRFLEKSLRIKAAQRQEMTDLPFEEKYEILRRIQMRSAEILAPLGITRRVWPPLQ